MKDDSAYFNCGIMVMNLKKWREDGISDKLKKMIKNGEAKFFYEVQDELNVLMEGKVKILPPKYNCTTAIFLFDYETMKIYRRPSTCCSVEDFEYGKKHPLIVHFTKNQIIQPRPWIKGCTHPYRAYYEKAQSETALADMKLWDVNRGVVNKIAYKFYTKGSKKALAYALGWVHSFLYPMFLYKFILR